VHSSSTTSTQECLLAQPHSIDDKQGEFDIHTAKATMNEMDQPITHPISPCTTKIDSTMSKVIKECQNTICYVCVEALHSRSSMKEEKQLDVLFEAYHGLQSGSNMAVQS
jgi:hypothetical protein